MSDAFATRLEGAQQIGDVDRRIQFVKELVAEELRSLHPQTSIHFTNYFDHAYVPDMVASWPGEMHDRMVFIRHDSNPRWMREDIATIGAQAPILFTPHPLPSSSSDLVGAVDRDELHAEALQSGAWILDSGSVDAFDSLDRDERTPVSLATESMLLGGRGVTGASEVLAIAEVATAGFQGASQLDWAETREAVVKFRSSLDHVQSRRLSGLLEAIWQGNGGSEASFPGPRSLGAISDADLLYMVRNLPQSDQDFWRRVASEVTTAQLGGLQGIGKSQSFNALVNAKLSTLKAKAVRIFLGDGDDTVVPSWTTSDGCLTLDTGSHLFRVAATRQEELPEPELASHPGFEVMKARVDKLRVPVTAIRLKSEADRSVWYASHARDNILEDEELRRLSDNFRGSVERIDLEISGSSTSANFETLTLSTVGRALAPLGELLTGSALILEPSEAVLGLSNASTVDPSEAPAPRTTKAHPDQLSLFLEGELGE